MDPKKALNLVAGICSKQEYCYKDIRQKLGKWELPEKEIQHILEFLSKNNFINEERFACAYARDKFRFNKWGKLKIKVMLRQKGIPETIIQKAITQTELNDYTDVCQQLLQQKRKSIKENDYFKVKSKLIRFGLARGFDYETINRCLNRLKDNSEGFLMPPPAEYDEWDE